MIPAELAGSLAGPLPCCVPHVAETSESARSWRPRLHFAWLFVVEPPPSLGHVSWPWHEFRLGECGISLTGGHLGHSSMVPSCSFSTRSAHFRRLSGVYGGETGIRTLDTLRYTRFPSVRLQPLGHLSAAWTNSLTLTYPGRWIALRIGREEILEQILSGRLRGLRGAGAGWDRRCAKAPESDGRLPHCCPHRRYQRRRAQRRSGPPDS